MHTSPLHASTRHGEGGGRHRAASRTRLLTAALGVLLLGASVAVSGGAAAQAATGPTLTAAPTTIAVGETSTLSATGLGDIENAGFGLDGTPGGSFRESGTTEYDAPVSDGRATATFTATREGSFTVAVGTGETPLASVTVVVTAPAPAQPATISADPAEVQTGASTTVSASGLGELQTVTFGSDATTGFAFRPGGATTQQSTVSGGAATAEFSAEEPGSYTVVVTDGETVLASTVITVTAPSTPAPEPTVTHAADHAQDDAGAPVLTWSLVGILALLIAGAVVAGVVLRRRHARRQDAVVDEAGRSIDSTS